MPARLSDAAMAQALFVSGLQPSERPSAIRIRIAVAEAIRRNGRHGCAGLAAQEFGDHPETAVVRMRWALDIVRAARPPGRRRAAARHPLRRRGVHPATRHRAAAAGTPAALPGSRCAHPGITQASPGPRTAISALALPGDRHKLPRTYRHTS
ncbi:MAG: hypothetical protein QOD41_5011 [Cryptosporangiaceae bacterium]|nr:hypothetical protein [Cryptosporangiaceae bacterium]